MSKTELEEELRDTLERAAASVPYTPDLIGRTRSGVRRRRRTWAASGVAAAGVAAVAVAGVALQGGPEAAPPTEPQAAATPSQTAGTTSAPTITMMSGTWQPMRMTGFTGLRNARPEPPVLAFHADGSWTGSDGCNGLQGTFKIGPEGQFTSTIGPQRLVGCDNVPHTAVLAAARKVTADQGVLRFFAADGEELASYARTR